MGWGKNKPYPKRESIKKGNIWRPNKPMITPCRQCFADTLHPAVFVQSKLGLVPDVPFSFTFCFFLLSHLFLHTFACNPI